VVIISPKMGLLACFEIQLAGDERDEAIPLQSGMDLPVQNREDPCGIIPVRRRD
jgi:hypothetical protein